MNVVIYKIKDAPNVVEKTLGETETLATLTAKPYETCDILSPSIIVDYNSAYNSANYMYISDFGRYYFISDIKLMPGNRALITGTVDVLTTYKNDLKNCPVTALRSESVGLNYCNDSKLPIDPSRVYTEGINFPNSIAEPWDTIDAHNYILIVNQGVNT